MDNRMVNLTTTEELRNLMESVNALTESKEGPYTEEQLASFHAANYNDNFSDYYEVIRYLGYDSQRNHHTYGFISEIEPQYFDEDGGKFMVSTFYVFLGSDGQIELDYAGQSHGDFENFEDAAEALKNFSTTR